MCGLRAGPTSTSCVASNWRRRCSGSLTWQLSLQRVRRRAALSPLAAMRRRLRALRSDSCGTDLLIDPGRAACPVLADLGARGAGEPAVRAGSDPELDGRWAPLSALA